MIEIIEKKQKGPKRKRNAEKPKNKGNEFGKADSYANLVFICFFIGWRRSAKDSKKKRNNVN